MILAKLMLMWQLASPVIVKQPIPGTHSLRDTTTNFLVIHYDSGANYSATRRWLIRRGNIYHYYIKRDGTIVQMLDPKYEGAHAGLSYWDGLFRMNLYSIGICLQRLPPETYTMPQYRSLAWLITRLESRFSDIRGRPILGHSDIAIPRGRKKDPGLDFRWDSLYILLDSIRITDLRRRWLRLDSLSKR